MRKICDKSGTIDFLARIVDEREALELPAVLERLLQLAVAHPVPNVLHITNVQHEVLNKDVVSATGGRDNIRKVGKFLDENNTVITARLEEGGDGVADEDGHQDRDAVGDLSSQLKHDHRDRDGVGHCAGERGSSNCRVAARHDEGYLVAVSDGDNIIFQLRLFKLILILYCIKLC